MPKPLSKNSLERIGAKVVNAAQRKSAAKKDFYPPVADTPTPPEFKFPKTMAACADDYYKTREKRLAIEREAAEIKAYESALKEHIIKNLPTSEATGVAGKVARVTIKLKPRPTLENDEQFFAYVKKTSSFFLLQRRLNESAIKEVWESGKQIPGVGVFTDKTLSVNKV